MMYHHAFSTDRFTMERTIEGKSRWICPHLILMLFVVTMTVNGCNPAHDPAASDESQQTLVNATETTLTPTERTEFVNMIETHLVKFETWVMALQMQAGELPEDQRERWNSTFRDLRHERQSVAEMLVTLNEKSGTEWEDYQRKVQEARDQLDRHYHAAERDFDFPHPPPSAR